MFSNRKLLGKDQLTVPALFNLFSRQSKHGEYFGQYFHDYIGHRRC
jgi:hypothetical protein